jgi:ferrous iron transport protein B
MTQSTSTDPTPAKGGSCHAASPGGADPAANGHAQVALVGNPNAGKTTLFNVLTGIRAKTANYPGTTLEVRIGAMRGAATPIELVDLPGLYSLVAGEAEERVALDKLFGRVEGHPGPRAVVLLVDATNLTRNLFLVSQVLEVGLPTVVALTMVDIADGRGMKLDVKALSTELGCPVVPITAKTGRGVSELAAEIQRLVTHEPAGRPLPVGLSLVKQEGADHLRYDWAEVVSQRCLKAAGRDNRALIEAVDRYLTHPIWGVAIFLAVMVVVFYLIFAVAAWPMDWIEAGIGALASGVAAVVPPGPLQSLLTNGVIGGVGGVLVFLPQICLIFFCLTILEDLGYMARAALVMDRLMRRVGLPGKAFVPMLSAHACAIPAIMATRMIENKRDRLVTILILPLLTCSARLPVYAMVTAMLFPDSPLKASLVFVGGYLLGMTAAIVMAMVIRRTILPGATQPLVIELPDYRRPSLKLALVAMADRAGIFLRRAGTVILAIAVVLWWLSTYPRADLTDLPHEAQMRIAVLQERADAHAAAGRPEDIAAAEAAQLEADNLLQEERMSYSIAGRLGHSIEPVIRPLGFDWRIGVGVISSFAAREVIVSTLSILYGLGEEGSEDAGALTDRMRQSTRPDGSPVFSFATCISLMVFFVLAMQCLPTQAVTKRETGQWRWAFLQLGYMTVLAYTAALIAYQTLSAFGLS